MTPARCTRLSLPTGDVITGSDIHRDACACAIEALELAKVRTN